MSSHVVFVEIFRGQVIHVAEIAISNLPQSVAGGYGTTESDIKSHQVVRAGVVRAYLWGPAPKEMTTQFITGFRSVLQAPSLQRDFFKPSSVNSPKNIGRDTAFYLREGKTPEEVVSLLGGKKR